MPLQKTAPERKTAPEDSLLAKTVPVRAPADTSQSKLHVPDDPIFGKKSAPFIKLINQVLDKGQCEGVQSFVLTEGMDGQGSWNVSAVLHVKGTKYSLWILKEPYRKPLMTITMASLGVLDSGAVISAAGPEWKVIEGRIPKSLSPAGKDLIFSSGSARGSEKKGAAYMDEFQKRYNAAVGILLKFYESK